jgi:hypothetical protein
MEYNKNCNKWTNHHRNDATSVNINNNLTTNPTNISDDFNTYFLSVAGNLLNNLPSILNTVNTDPLEYLKNNYSKPNDKIYLKNSSTHEIDKVIHSLKWRDSHGYDEVSTRIIKISAPYILSPLTLISNRILSPGEFPKIIKFL